MLLGVSTYLKMMLHELKKTQPLVMLKRKKITGAKYSALMAPIIVALERRLESTSCKEETVHELWFQKEYGKQLKSAILSFKIPPASASVLGDVWQAFDAIAASLVNYQRTSSICLSEVAPNLALLSSSSVPMPGLERQSTILDTNGCFTDFQGIITVSSFNEQVGLLTTKTRPKKLVLLGSDGQKYTYLLKGREDLRLDARIMQLLQAINCCFASSADSLGQSLGVRYYSVTPISGQAGLIQWVERVTSIYSVYKSWQNHNQLSQLYSNGGMNSNPVPAVLRPSDMFYGKIIPALKEKGIRRVVSRRDWPHEVKRKVLLDLMQETPRQLLWQELWCASEGFKSFHSKIRRFSWSVAAMSIIGHVVGLGDRHLDNILIDFSSGEVVHIDYNVCFDKGRRLKIPEIVPFRLTQTIEAALGLTGVEGVFRANCETVINLLRKNKDIVIMLLEVFVWDPLVEWTREDPHDKAVIAGEEKKGMELAVSLSLFASRFQEIRVPLQEHHDLLASTLPAAESALKRFLGVLIEFEVVSAIFYHADKERSRLLQHETTAKSIAAEASCFSEKSRAYFEAQALEYAQGKSLATEKAQEVTSWIEEHGRVLDALRSHSFLDSEAFIKLGSMDDSLSLTSAVLILGVPLTVVPESTQAHCSDLDGEISRIIAGLDNELSSAVDALNEYGLILQQILPLNYVVTSPFNRLAQVLELSVNNPSADVLSLARKQAADIVSSSSGTALDSLQKKHQDLLSSMEMHAMEIETFDKERSKLLSLIESDSEPKAKERLLSAFTKLMQPEGHGGREDDSPVDDFRDFKMLGNLHKKKGELLFLLNMAVSDLYKDVKEKLASISKVSGQRISWKTDDSPLNDSSFISTELEVHIEKCILLTGLLHEVQNFVGKDLPSFNIDSCRTSSSEHDWTTDFHVILHSVKMWFENFTECVLAEIIEAFVFCNTEVMETLASLSQIRGSIDTALQKLVEVELERESLMELEKSYFMKVEIITEQQLALQEAASRDHDHLSWEEAEELANQVESCRTQLEQLHQSWNQKDVRIAALARIDASIMNSLASLEGYFSSLVDIETNGASQSRRSNSFLAALVKPFTELESIDLLLSSYLSSDSYLSEPLHTLSDLAKSGFSLSDSVWMFPYIIKKHSLFIWKVGIIDSIINSLIFDVSASFDHSLGLYQLSSIFRKKLEVHLQKYHCQYLKEKVILALLAQLDKVDENLRQMIEAKNDFIYKITMDDSEPLRSVRLMLEEYCIAQETARAARSAANAMKEHVKQRTEALYKTVLEIFRIEWLHEKTVPQVLNTKVYLQNAFGDNKLACLALKTNRSTLLEKMLSSISSMAGSLEHLQAFEKTSTSAEAQIERALGWVYAGPNIVGSGNSPSNRLGIPPEFHDHLLRRRKLLWKAHEQASDIIKFCTYVIEFEASRESFFWTNEETKAGQILDDSHTLKQSSLIALTRLDNSYQSFARAEQEWKLSQDKMEAAAKSVLSATNELCIASGKVKSASSDLQQNIATLRECVYEASLALSSFCSVSKEHIALASECGSILEEVLVITESLHDVYGYAKEASMMHKSFMADLSQAMIVLLPLEASLSSDVASMTNTKSKEKESSIDVSPIHGEGLYQSYCFRLQETCQILESLVPSITFSVKELYSMLAKLARAASIHAGNLNKALEGVADSEVVISQEISLSRPDFLDGMHANENINLGPVEGILFNDTVPVGEFTSDDEGWISPPDCSYTSSQAFSLTAIDTEEDSNDLEQTRLPNSSRSNISRQETLSHEKSIAECINNDAHSIQSSSSVPPILGKIEGSTVNNSLQMLTIEEVTSVDVIPSESLSPSRGLEGSYEDPIGSNPLGLLKRGKNAYAMSALRQIEYKIEGRDIEDGRIMQASLLVDHLIKEATNIDNLCNMYEGWTPWI